VSLPPHSIVNGQSVGDWATSGDPFDTNGELGHQNNHGKVSYVAGTSSGTATRSFSVAAGKLLLVLPVNFSTVQFAVPLENQLIASLNAAAPTRLTATIDGVPVPNLSSHLGTSGVF